MIHHTFCLYGSAFEDGVSWMKYPLRLSCRAWVCWDVSVNAFVLVDFEAVEVVLQGLGLLGCLSKCMHFDSFSSCARLGFAGMSQYMHSC